MRKSRKVVKKEKREKTSAVEKIGEALEMPVYDITGTPYIEMIGNREFMIENCKGIIEYSEECIRISAGRYIVKICGRGMALIGMQEKSLHVQGVIDGVEFII